MPPRKEPKETVTYPASKRKPPPFKPQRPSKVPRTTSTAFDEVPKAPTSNQTQPRNTVPRISTAKAVINSNAPAKKGTIKQLKAAADRRAGLAQKSRRALFEEENDDDDDDSDDNESASDNQTKGPGGQKHQHNSLTLDSSDEPTDEVDVGDKPMPSTSAVRTLGGHTRDFSPLSSSQHSADDTSSPKVAAAELPSSIPAPLLIRLLHEHSTDKGLKIDKHAIQVLGKYFDVFVREAIARAALQKQSDVEGGLASQSDVGWLELQDLEKIAPGLLLDF